jgi:hypothetical protein
MPIALAASSAARILFGVLRVALTGFSAFSPISTRRRIASGRERSASFGLAIQPSGGFFHFDDIIGAPRY